MLQLLVSDTGSNFIFLQLPGSRSSVLISKLHGYWITRECSNAPWKWSHASLETVWRKQRKTQPISQRCKRRLRGTSIHLKNLNKFNNVNHLRLFVLQANSRIRDKDRTTQVRRCSADIGGKYLSNRFVHHWNSSPAEVVRGYIIRPLTNRIDRLFAVSWINRMCPRVNTSVLIVQGLSTLDLRNLNH